MHGNRFQDLTNQTFGNLFVKSFAGKDRYKRSKWLCGCSCGNEKIADARHLKSGRVKSCGCLVTINAIKVGKDNAHKISGDLCYMYKPELTYEERFLRRNLFELRKWRKEVFSRDNYTCKICGERGARLNAHHLYSWFDYPDMRFNLENGVTLCRKHHKDFHSWMGGNNVSCQPKDFEEYISIVAEGL